MSPHPFYFPADTPEMTFTALAARLQAVCSRSQCMSYYATIGTTVQVRWRTTGRSSILVRLYETTIAILSWDGTIRFPNDDPHMTTTEWISKIIYDNGLGSRAWRIRRRASDPPGPEISRGRAGLLCIDGDRDKPVHGRPWCSTRSGSPATGISVRSGRPRWPSAASTRTSGTPTWPPRCRTRGCLTTGTGWTRVSGRAPGPGRTWPTSGKPVPVDRNIYGGNHPWNTPAKNSRTLPIWPFTGWRTAPRIPR